MILRALTLQWMTTVCVGVVSLTLSVSTVRLIGPSTFGKAVNQITYRCGHGVPRDTCYLVCLEVIAPNKY